MAGKRTIELDEGEVALIVGEEEGSMTVRVVPATELADEITEVPEPYEVAVALAMRLLNDPEFHDDMLDWYESQEEAEDEEDEEDGEDEEGDEDEEDEEEEEPKQPGKPE